MRNDGAERLLASGASAGPLFTAAWLGQGVAELSGLFGLLQRITVTIGFAWLTALAVHLRMTGAGQRSLAPSIS